MKNTYKYTIDQKVWIMHNNTPKELPVNSIHIAKDYTKYLLKTTAYGSDWILEKLVFPTKQDLINSL